MLSVIKKARLLVNGIFERDRFVKNHNKSSNFKNQLNLQVIISLAFFLLSAANVFAHSYVMLALTVSGCVINAVFAALAKKFKNGNLSVISAISTCSALFAFFVIYGGNDGFACLWVILLPLLSMVVMDFVIGICASAVFQVFLIVVFWTPIREMLAYRYNDQFCLRFPLFFLVTFMLGLLLTISLRRSEYNECKHLIELEKMTEKSLILARTDFLTKMVNRRKAYEEFKSKYMQEGVPHCIVMGDIDCFKRINDTYGHEFGDEVLVRFSKYANEILPQDYLKVRWGGEEFLFAANAALNEVYLQIEKLRCAFENHEFIQNGMPVHITITFGIAQYTGSDDLNNAINAADARLYEGKNGTKNCTVAEQKKLLH